MRKYRLVILFVTWVSLTAAAQKHTQFVGLSLEMPSSELVEQLVNKGLQQEDSLELSGRIAGLDVWVTVGAGKDSTGCDYVMVTTQEQQGQSVNADYVALMQWMQKRYGRPNWEAAVRSYRFARWFVGFDRDIVMVMTAASAVEIWFYDNHETRNLDYYSILKYCERHPAEGVPFYTARDCVVWKSSKPVVTPQKKVPHKSKKSRRHHQRRSHRRR